MKVAFRVDCSTRIGTGHLMRCLTLAGFLRQAGHESIFLMRHAETSQLLKNNGYSWYALSAESAQNHDPDVPHAGWLSTTWQQDAEEVTAMIRQLSPDILVVDHYALDAKWQKRLKPHCRSLVALDDLADRQHACDLLIDGNINRCEADYAPLVTTATRLLTGCDYLILRQEFSQLRDSVQARRAAKSSVERLLLFMGGTDPLNITLNVLKMLEPIQCSHDCMVDVVMGYASASLQDVQEQVASAGDNYRLHVDTPGMAELIGAADLAIGATGSTTWERCCLGLPTLSICFAENQRYADSVLRSMGVIDSIEYEALDDSTFRYHLQQLLENADLRRTMSARAFQLVDGLGASRILRHLEML